MKRKALALTFILALLFSAVAGAYFVDLGRANPYFFGGNTAPPEGTEPPTISIFSPENNTIIASANVSLAFNASISEYTSFLTEVYYKTDWQEGNTSVFHLDMTTSYYREITEFSYNKTLTGIPDGNHSITVIAATHGSYVRGMTAYHFDIGCFSSVNFVIDTTPPSISFSSLQNKTYGTSDIALNFTLSEPFSQITYILDGQENVTVAGNTTLTGLAEGAHNVTVYAKDALGNTGASETIYFSVDVPFPTPLVIAPIASVAVVGAGLSVYFKKRKR